MRSEDGDTLLEKKLHESFPDYLYFRYNVRLWISLLSRYLIDDEQMMNTLTVSVN